MRGLFIVALLAACGRVGFDDLAAGDGGAGDGSSGDAPGNALCGFRDRPTLAMGSGSTCVVRLDGTLWCAGSGYGTRFQRVDSNDRYLRVDGEETGFCTLDVDCQLACFGENTAGELGTGDTMPRALPTVVTPGTRYRDVGAGGFHTCAIREDGALLCWGENLDGELGLGDTMNRPLPTRVGNGTWKRVERGYLFSCAFDSTDRLWCWGANEDGQIGQGSVTPASVRAPVEVMPKSGPWIAATLGKQHMCALDSSRGLWCWGFNAVGQVGRGDTVTPIPAPQRVGPAVAWEQVVAGRFTTCALAPDHALWCWGDNAFGAVGVPGPTNQTSPVQLASPATWSALSPMNISSCAFDAAGDLYCWGQNDMGQLGLGDMSPRTVPAKVTFP